MDAYDTLKKISIKIQTSVTFKILSIGILLFILLIPTTMISSLMRERQGRRNTVVREINHKWGNLQTITGPFITVPYKEFYKNEKGELNHTIQHLHFLPEKLNIKGDVHPSIRYRSIYEAVLYNALLNINGQFTLPETSLTGVKKEDIFWDQAMLSIGISDMRGIKENIVFQFNENDYKASPGLKTSDLASSGVMSVIPLSPEKKIYPFHFNLNLNGSEVLYFTPVAEFTEVNLNSKWPSPSFAGSFLPVEREISEKGFSAKWNVLHLNRNYPQFWQGAQYKVQPSEFGLKLLITANVYQKSIRIIKYAVMFILFTFAAFFFSEIINKIRIHPIQYLLIGLGVILFYVLLLSFSEHIRFDIAYFISAAATTGLITAYSKGILKNMPFTITVFGILTLLYIYLYIVLQLEDYSLIMGSVGLFLILGVVMYLTRNIDWFSVNEPS